MGAESEAGYTEGTKMSGTSFPMDDSEIAERSAKFRSGSVQRLWLSGECAVLLFLHSKPPLWGIMWSV